MWKDRLDDKGEKRGWGLNALNYSQLEEKSNEELFALYKETRSQEVKQELTMRYVYIVRSIAYQMREM